ncbi:Hypothetical predicted protein [Xyrichtys novacula]|uniref:Uncharacterized protein n=1 Tax=Xyrichtys novacula TaxID=13765 RepID=A0AAV1HEE2_XYRNO|nr:Hypothetical predicted protein [Xyrichtys novacula]
MENQGHSPAGPNQVLDHKQAKQRQDMQPPSQDFKSRRLGLLSFGMPSHYLGHPTLDLTSYRLGNVTLDVTSGQLGPPTLDLTSHRLVARTLDLTASTTEKKGTSADAAQEQERSAATKQGHK